MPELDLFIPGRLCLLGEHSDWAGGYRRVDSSISRGYCLLVGTDQGIYAKVHPDKNKLKLTSLLPDGKKIGPHEIRMDEKELLNAACKGEFFSYCAGVAYHILRKYPVQGLQIESYKMDLPIRKGLSSSAAINVLTVRAFNKIYNLNLTRREEMELAYQGEILTPSRCGRMDQACAYGRTPIFLTLDGDNIDIEEIHPQKHVNMVIVDLKAGKDTQRILADLNACFPRTTGKIAQNVRHYLGTINEDILRQAKKLLTEGNAKELGRLMTESQKLFDELVTPACPSELTAPKLHQILSYSKIQDLIWGGKGVGSQGDGCAQFVCKGPDERKQLHKLLPELNVECFELTIHPQK